MGDGHTQTDLATLRPARQAPALSCMITAMRMPPLTLLTVLAATRAEAAPVWVGDFETAS